jgi:hypothetical protein
MWACFNKLTRKGLLIDKEIIRFNINMQSLIQVRLE